MSERKSSLEIKIQGHQPIDGNHTTRQNETTEGEYKGRRNSGSESVGIPSTEWPGNGDEPAKQTEKEFSEFQIHCTVMNLETKTLSGFNVSTPSAIQN